MIKILQPDLNGNERAYVNQCFDEGWISSQGRFVQEFEQSISKISNGRKALSVSNGTVAIHLALVSLGIGRGDEVIVPDVTFGATLNAIMLTGATPVIIDIDPVSWNMDPNKLDTAKTKRTKAVLPVPLYGNPTAVNTIYSWTKENNVFCVVDAAEAIGAKIGGVDISQYGDCVTYSYFGNKTITTGEGGAIVFKDKHVYNNAKILRDHGMAPDRRYHHVMVGFNYRLTNLQAAIGVAQYERLGDIIDKKRKIVEFYLSHIKQDIMVPQVVQKDCMSSNWVFGLKMNPQFRQKIEKSLSQNNIEYRRGFEPMHIQPAFQTSKISGTMQHSKELYDGLLLLPSHPGLSENDLASILECLSI